MGSIDKTPPHAPGAEAAQVPGNSGRKKTKAPVSVGRGVIGKNHVAKLRAVPKSSKSQELEAAMHRFKPILKQTAPASPGPFPYENKVPLFNALGLVLVLMTDGNRDDQALYDATESLVNACVSDKTLSPNPEKADANAGNIRAASKYFRERQAIEPTILNLNGDALSSARVRFANWLVPLYEIKDEQRAHRAFLRLLGAAQEVKERSGPDAAARLMAWAFKSAMPISRESEEDLRRMWSCLHGAKTNDVVDAQRLLIRYQEAIDRHSPNVTQRTSKAPDPP